MPITNVVDAGRGIVVTTASGVVGDEDFRRARGELLADPAFDPAFDRLWDFTGVTGEFVSDATLAELVASSPSRTRAVRAVVCATPAAITRVLSFIETSRKMHRQVAVLPTRDAAEAWILATRETHAADQSQEPGDEPA